MKTSITTLTTVLLIFLQYTGYSQNNKVIVHFDSINQHQEVLNYLVELAITQSPQIKKSHLEMERVDVESSSAKWDWLDNMAVSFNYNEAHAKQGSEDFTSNAFYPKYNLSLKVNLSLPMKQIYTNKTSKIDQKIVHEENTMLKQELRSEMAILFEDYLMNKELLKLSAERVEAARLQLELSENESDDVQLYDTNLTKYQQAKIGYIKQLNEYKKSIYAIEAIIGTKHNIAW
ncbi:TolC family protein [Limibacter armeniacum]|uniref:TolC family protein n=1 Tax=Limibacter armeniacum TaxID=466084 RepID=UPI002FE5F18A